MSLETSFTVSRFLNRNGVTSWRVSGFIAGVRIRKNFPSREEAAAEKSTLELRAAQATSGQRAVATCLTSDQLREAEAVFRRIAAAPAPKTLSFYLDYALSNYHAPEQDRALDAAVTEYLATKGQECVRNLISGSQPRGPRGPVVRAPAGIPP